MIRLFAPVALLLLAPAAVAEPVEGEKAGSADAWHRLVSILQYLQADYPLAIESQSEFELEEQRSFIAEALRAAGELGPAGATFVPRLESLQARIEEAADPEGVSRDAGTLIEQLVQAGGLTRSPRRPPDLANGAALFKTACAPCHGIDGSGDVPIAATMEPQPPDFRTAEVIDGLTAYKAFNVIGFGISGTPMPAFPSLTEEERWDLAFHLFSFRHRECKGASPKASLERLATATDPELAAIYGADAVPCLRLDLPAADEEESLLRARGLVEEAVRKSAAGDVDGARRAVLDAYLHGLEPVEPLLGARDPQLVLRLEQAFMSLRIAAEKSPPDVPERARELLGLIDQARRGPDGASGFLAVFWMAVAILVREGFEATVVIAALLAVLRRTGQPQHARIVHLGWITALFAGALLYYFGRALLSGADREALEGGVALFATAMLLYAALWLNSHAQTRQFMGELREKMQASLGRGSVAGLFLIAFTAMLRESFETALFLQALAIDSPSGALWGAMAGVALLVGLVLAVRVAGIRLPMRTLFKASTAVLLLTAVALLGKGLRAFQETGAIPLQPIPFVQIELLGVYPDLWTLLPQLVLALVCVVAVRAQRMKSASPAEIAGA